MLQVERHKKIIEIISRKGSAKVDDLAMTLDVSLMTIRRDLEKLSQEGRIDRIYGGAIIKKETPYTEKKIFETEVKYKIAQVAMKYVKCDNTVYLDSGTTSYEIAKLIKDIPGISVTTNDIEIARLLIDSNVDINICGGNIQKSTGSVIGQLATQTIENLRFDISFFGAMTIDDEFNVLTPTMDKAVMKRTICKNSKEKYLVIDKSKFGREAFVKINHLSDYTAVITNKKFSIEEKKELRHMRITLIQV